MDAKRVYETEYAGHAMRYTFRVPGTAALFGDSLKETCGEPDISETEEFFRLARSLMPHETAEYAEFRSLICLTSKPLLKHGCCLFHSAAFVYDGLAWLLTAPSGTGKTTQFLNWERYFPGEIRMISGDVPVVEAAERGLWAHPSPWNGKEGFRTPGLTAPIGGVVLLEQGDEDRIAPLTPAESIYPLLSQFIVLLENEEEVAGLARIADRLLRGVPMMKLVNRGGRPSTELLRTELNRIASGRKGT